MSVNIVSQFQSSTFSENYKKTITHPAARLLCDSWASCSFNFSSLFLSSLWHRSFHAGCSVVDRACVSRRSCGAHVYHAIHAPSITWQMMIIFSRGCSFDSTHYYCTSNWSDRIFATLSSCDQYCAAQTWLGCQLKVNILPTVIYDWRRTKLYLLDIWLSYVIQGHRGRWKSKARMRFPIND